MRRQDWVARLREAVREGRRAPFSYGRADCCRFAARCVDAVTGSSILAELEALYQDRRGAARTLILEGGLSAAVTRRLGLPVESSSARRGDICQVGGKALGVCWGGAVLAVSASGLTALPLSSVRRHWRVD